MKGFALILVSFFAIGALAESVQLVNFVVMGSGRSVGNAAVGTAVVKTNVCWIQVSDGTTMYNASLDKGMFGNCPVVAMNSQITGGVSKNQKYLLLLFPRDKGKTKKETYTISAMQNVKAAQ